MSEKVPSSAPAEIVETKGELSEERKQGLGKRILKVFSALHEMIGGQPKMSDLERAAAREKQEINEKIASLTKRRDAVLEQLQDPNLSDFSRGAAESDLEYKSIRIMNLQLREVCAALPSPLPMLANDSLDPDTNSELVLGMGAGRIDKIMPKLVEIADRQARPEDLRATLGDLNGPVTQERVSELRLFLRSEPIAKALAGDMSDFTEVYEHRTKGITSLTKLTYDRSYRAKLQGRLESEDLSDLERQAIQEEIKAAEHRIGRVEARKQRAADEYRRANGIPSEPESEYEPEAESPSGPEYPLEVPESSEAPETSEEPVMTFDSFLKSARRAAHNAMERNAPPEMLDEVKQDVLNHYEKQVAEVQRSVDEKGDAATPEDIAYLNSRKDALARSQASFIAHRLPSEMSGDFLDATDFDSDPSIRDERFVLPVLVDAARGDFDVEAVTRYLEETAGNMPEEKRSKILRKYHDFLQALLDNNQ